MLAPGISQTLSFCVFGPQAIYQPRFQAFESFSHLSFTYAPDLEALKQAVASKKCQVLILDSGVSPVRLSMLSELLMLDFPDLILCAILQGPHEFEDIYPCLEEGMIHFYLYQHSLPREFQAMIRGALKKHSDLVINQELVHKVKHYNQKLQEEVKKQTGKLEEASKKRNLYFHFIVHELKNPLTALEGLLDLLSGMPACDEEREELLSLARFNSREMLCMVNTLLEYSRSEEVQMTLYPKSFCWQEMLEKVSRGYRMLAAKKGIQFQISGTEKPIIINADLEKLEMALSNLMGNAVKYTEKGKITLAYEVKSDHLEFSIEDTGQGIPEKELELIFEPYQRSSLSGGISGTGLGLAFTRRMIEAHGGILYARSAGPLQGSCFFASLPLNYHP